MELLFVLFWGGLLWYIAVTPKVKMEMTWLIMVFLIAVSPLIPLILPSMR